MPPPNNFAVLHSLSEKLSEHTKYIRTCLATSLMNATPGSNVGNTTEPYLRTSGTGLMRIVTSVMTPRIPGGGGMDVRMHNKL